MRFHFNDSKSLKVPVKKEFSILNKLGTSQLCRLKFGQIAEISHNYHAPQKLFPGHILILL